MDNSNIEIEHFGGLVGKTVEGNVVIDQGVWLEEAKSAIALENPLTDQAKIEFAEKYVRTHLQDASYPYLDDQETYQKHQVAIDRVLKSDEPRSISEVLEGGYGVCPDFQALELALLDQMGMEAYLAGNPIKAHLFLFVKQDDSWVVSDPFAQSHLEARGSNQKKFPATYYQGPDIKLFEKTVSAGASPEIQPLPAAPTRPSPTISLSDLKARVAGNKNDKH